MSHHSEDVKDLRKYFRTAQPELGPTGEYPRGKLTDDDEGEIKVGIAADRSTGTVVIDFGKPVAWIGFSADQAVEIGQMLIDKATEARGA